MQSYYHQYNLPEYLDDKILVLPNGIQSNILKEAMEEMVLEAVEQAKQTNSIAEVSFPSLFNNANKEYKFIYGRFVQYCKLFVVFLIYFLYCCSAPNRGLEDVLRIWFYIKSIIPSAELHIYYGFGYAVAFCR